jgi:AcrR family transcriptional regulator
MDATHPQRAARRDGQETRALAQQTALRLFTDQGYESTSLRQIADEIGINKASLYYYFDSKEAILQSLVEERGDEAEALLAWVRDQPRTPDLLHCAVRRWVESFSPQKLQGIRFLAANPLILNSRKGQAGSNRIGTGLSQLAHELADLLPERSPANVALLRMALLSINAAVQAAANTDLPDDAIVAAAQRAAAALISTVAGAKTLNQ